MEIALVIFITAAAVYLFATEKYPPDLVAIMVLGGLVLISLLPQFGGWIRPGKWITPQEGVSGFSNPATITVAAMFVLSAGLQKTGAVRSLGRWLARMGKFPWLLNLVMMLTVGVVSAFINNTAAVAVFLPIILAVCERRKFSPSRFLIPLSFASQFGGVCTLIGTSTNLLVSSISEQAGAGPFAMFELTPLGLITLGAGVLYVSAVGYWLLPARRGEQLTEAYGLGEYVTELRLPPASSLVGRPIPLERFRQLDVAVLELLRGQTKIWSPVQEPLQAGDVLLVRGRINDLMELKTAWGLEIEPEFKLKDEALETEDLALAEVLVAPRSALAGHTLAEVAFRRHYNAIVLAIQRRGQTIREKLNQVRLRFGDALLLLGPKEEFARLRNEQDLIVLNEVEEPSRRQVKVPAALGIIALVVGLAATNAMPILVSSILGCIALVVTRCLTLEEAYEAIDWKVIFMLAGVLPLGLAMQKSGAAELLAQHALGVVGPWGPIAVLAGLYLITAVLTEFMSHNATAVLLAPIAISTAATLGVSAKPFLMAVCFAASTSFSTPVGYQTNTMVYNAGGYKFTDFVKVGLPLNLIFWALAVYFIPKFWAF